MSTVAEIKAAIPSLTLEERAEVARCLSEWQDDKNQPQSETPPRVAKNWPRPRKAVFSRATARTFQKSSPRSNESPLG